MPKKTTPQAAMRSLIAGYWKERTKEEFSALFRKAGLKLTRVVPTASPLSIVEGARG